MRIHYFQHVPFEGSGAISPWVQANGHTLSATRLFGGEGLPKLEDIDWLIVLGGPMGVQDDHSHPWLTQEKRFIEKAIKNGKTVLGICLGAQLIADVLGAKVFRNRFKEIGWFPIELTATPATAPIFRKLPQQFEAFHWHGDTFDLPAGATRVAQSAACENQAFVYEERIVGLQFHLETTREGAEQLIKNCAEDLTEAPFIRPPSSILASDTRFAEINKKMEILLDELERSTTPISHVS